MSRRSDRERASRLAEFREADAAYKETRDPKHAAWRARAMQGKDMREGDTKRANEILVESVVAERDRNNQLLKDAGFTGWTKKEQETNG